MAANLITGLLLVGVPGFRDVHIDGNTPPSDSVVITVTIEDDGSQPVQLWRSSARGDVGYPAAAGTTITRTT
jgi:hypothetical protein